MTWGHFLSWVLCHLMSGINSDSEFQFIISPKMTTMASHLATLSLLCVLRMLILGAQATADPKAESSLPQGYVAHPDIGVAYKVYAGYISWPEAEGNCTLDGAHLAVINSAKKLEYALSPEQTFGVRHVGLQRVGGTWVTVTNGPVKVRSIPWKEGHPVRQANCNCAFVGWKDWSTQIMSGPCEYQGDYICELPLPAESA